MNVPCNFFIENHIRGEGKRSIVFSLACYARPIVPPEVFCGAKSAPKFFFAPDHAGELTTFHMDP